jgi:hypothetical protein
VICILILDAHDKSQIQTRIVDPNWLQSRSGYGSSILAQSKSTKLLNTDPMRILTHHRTFKDKVKIRSYQYLNILVVCSISYRYLSVVRIKKLLKITCLPSFAGPWIRIRTHNLDSKTSLSILNSQKSMSWHFRPMVLMVGKLSESSLELTDGWYSLQCRVAYGSPLHGLLLRGLITQVS